jgi:hypothetical protein
LNSPFKPVKRDKFEIKKATFANHENIETAGKRHHACFLKSKHVQQQRPPTKTQQSTMDNHPLDSPISGSRYFEQLASTCLLNKKLEPHLATSTKNRMFRGAFGCSQHDVYLCWSILNVENEGPAGGLPLHLLWTLLFLKTYDLETNLSSRCGVDPKTFRKWTWLFLERIAELPLVCSRGPTKTQTIVLTLFYCIFDTVG